MFRKGGAALGVVQSLSQITDHPKISVDPKEYNRIALDKRYFEGKFPAIKFRNTYGQLKERPYVTLNMMQVICRRMASLLYNEQSKITIETRAEQTDDNGQAVDYKEPDEADTFIHDVLEDNDFNKNFERYLESCLALGGIAIRPYVDYNTKKIKLAWVQAPSFYPLRSNTNDVSNAAIATRTVRTEGHQNVYYTLLEFHEWSENQYTVTNELYRSEVSNEVGIKVDLGTLYPDLTPIAQLNPTVFTRPLFVYLKPAGFNNRNITSPLGIGITDNALNTLKQLNDAYDQFNWEVRMGQRRVAVPDNMTEVVFDQSGQHKPQQVFDPDQNVFLSIQGGGMDARSVQDLTTPIRSADYIASLNHFLKTLEMQVGLSSGTFSFDTGGNLQNKTATEVVSENSMTYQTRNSHLTMVERAVQELCVSICELASATIIDGSALYDGPTPTIDQVTVDFDDGVFTDKSASLDYWIKVAAAGFAPKQVAIARALDVPDDVAKQYAEQAATESKPAMPQDNQGGLFGGDGDS
jgi:A118 family predicted phage portal protein